MKWLNRLLMQSPICYGVCFTEVDFHKELSKMKIDTSEWPDWIIPGSDATTHWFATTESFDECCIVCIRKTKHPVHQIASMLAHEGVHIWQKIKISIGEREPSDEFEAYAIQNITYNLVEAYYDKGKKK